MSLYPFRVGYDLPVQGTGGGRPVPGARLMGEVEYKIAPALAGAATVLASTVLVAPVAPATSVVVTTGITRPDVCRTLKVAGNAAGIVGNVVITGADAAGKLLVETVALSGTTSVETANAFSLVNSIALPGPTNASGDAVTVGTGAKLGLPHILTSLVDIRSAEFNGAADTGYTWTMNAVLSKNFYTSAGTFNGTKILRLVYVV